MRRIFLLACTLIAFLFVSSQDFSNKGKEFWIAYGNHVRMFEAVTSQNPAEKMQLYMTSDVNTSGVVEIPGINFKLSFNIIANQITSVDIPRTAALLDEGSFDLGIHVTALKPIVVYSFIYVNAISGATVCLPLNTLGKDYYSINYTQISNNNNSYSYFNVIATDTGNTSIEILPAQKTKGGKAAGVPYVINLKQGQVYQALGALNTTTAPFSGVDLTGSRIRSISSGGICKKIAVFCGSGKISIGCSGAGTSDNLYQQMYPVNTWGKTYITVPGINAGSSSNQNNYYRIFKSVPSTDVKLNGAILPPSAFVNNQYYEFSNSQANFVEADQPILVAQYLTTGGCGGNTGQGDPEMIYLNPVEQTISAVTLNSMQPSANTNINEHHINVVLKNTPQAIGSFKIDGASAGQFKTLASNSTYAYAQITVTKGTHTLTSDSGFNAIAYGFGNAESYGYSAGTNLKDLYQFVSIENEYAVVNFPVGCKNSPFRFSMTFPYKPTKIKWLFKGLFQDTTVVNPLPDSSWVVNGRSLYKYTLNKTYLIAAIGTYPITLIADNPTGDGCSGEQEIDYDLQIFERPKADFSISKTGCLIDPVKLYDTTNGNGRPIIRWLWNFGDGDVSSVKNPTHPYTKSGTYNISLSSITDVGCLSDTAVKAVVFTDQPVAGFTLDEAICEKRIIKITDVSTPATGLVKWLWNFGDGTTSTQRQPTHFYSSVGNYKVSLDVETSTGCKSTFTLPVNVYYLPNTAFSMPEICVGDPMAEFYDSTSIADNSTAQLKYIWGFGDANATPANPNMSNIKNPKHSFTSVGVYDIDLKVTSKDGCAANLTKKLTVNGAIPRADFQVANMAQLCSNKDVVINDLSTVDFGSITKVEVFWDYGNDPTIKTLDDDPRFGKTYAHKYGDFNSAPTKEIQIIYVAYSGNTCLHQASKTITLQASPQIQFSQLSPACEEVASFAIAPATEANSLPGTGIYSGTGLSSSGVFSPAVAKPGLHTLRYSFTATNGCSAYGEQTILVYPQPFADAGPDRSVLEGGSIKIEAKASTNAAYLWTPDLFLDDNKLLTPKVSPLQDTRYQLKVASQNGCASTDEVLIKILKEVKVPNAFSPNGDGINDTWNILYLESYPDATVEVFNRYGQLVYRSKGYGRQWNGESSGRPLPLATYYYIIDPKNGRARITGSVSILR